MREQFTFYRSFYEAITKLRKKEDRLSIYDAIAAYALNGEEIAMTDNAQALFILVKPNLDAAARKSSGGKSTPSMRKDGDKKPARLPQDTDKEKEKEKEKEIELELKKEKKETTRFTPPTLDEVTAYCRQRGNAVNPQRFVAYYSSNGWKVGRNPMKDWKAAVITWEQGDKKAETSKQKDVASMARYVQDVKRKTGLNNEGGNKDAETD